MASRKKNKIEKSVPLPKKRGSVSYNVPKGDKKSGKKDKKSGRLKKIAKKIGKKKEQRKPISTKGNYLKIRRYLWNKYRDKFENYADLLRYAGKVNKRCKTQSCTNKYIGRTFRDILKKPKRKRKFTPPTLPPKNHWLHIRKYLWEKYRDKFENYADCIRYAREINKICRTTPGGCSDERIDKELGLLLTTPYPPKPVISSDLMTDPKNYWEIKDVEFATFEPYLWIYSPMIMPSPYEFEIQKYFSIYEAQTAYQKSYETWFKEWVDWCNEWHRENDEPYYICFIFSPVYWNEEKSRWETEILTCDDHGIIHDFGFRATGEVHDVGNEFIDLDHDTGVAPVLPVPVDHPLQPPFPEVTEPEETEDIEESEEEEIEEKPKKHKPKRKKKARKQRKAKKRQKSKKKVRKTEKKKTDAKQKIKDQIMASERERMLLSKRVKNILAEVKMWHELGDKKLKQKAIIEYNDVKTRIARYDKNIENLIRQMKK